MPLELQVWQRGIERGLIVAKPLRMTKIDPRVRSSSRMSNAPAGSGQVNPHTIIVTAHQSTSRRGGGQEVGGEGEGKDSPL